MPIHPNVRQCNHIKMDGVRCGSPALTGNKGCYFHANVLQRTKDFILPPLEDANAIQFAVMEVMRALLEKRMDRAMANTMLYALQVAHTNLRGLTVAAPLKSLDHDDNEPLARLLLEKLNEDDPDPEIEAALNPYGNQEEELA